jgi:hypothetical protein
MLTDDQDSSFLLIMKIIECRLEAGGPYGDALPDTKGREESNVMNVKSDNRHETPE